MDGPAFLPRDGRGPVYKLGLGGCPLDSWVPARMPVHASRNTARHWGGAKCCTGLFFRTLRNIIVRATFGLPSPPALVDSVGTAAGFARQGGGDHRRFHGAV